jgi:PAS domain S-box-containing protein
MTAPAHLPTEALPTLRILIVDDNRTNLQILQVFLKKLGHTTISGENGEQAVSLCAAQKPDLILLDIMMPVMDGFEAARRIRAQPSDRWVPIIFLSALDRDENLVTGLEAGGDDFMSKPINFVVLEAKMRAMQRMLLLQRRATESLQRIQVISDNVLDALITIDASATIIACNPSCERIFGWTLQEMIGQNIKMLMPQPYREEHDTYVSNYVAGGIPKIIGIGREASAMRKDGSIFPMELGVSEIFFDNQRLFVGLLRDISERKASERKLLENAEQLQRYFDETEAENRLARSFIEQQLHRPSLSDSQLHFFIAPAQNFSGDIIAAARSENGRLYALLADATGHGLTAAISTLPVLTIFYGMAPSGLPLSEIVGEINSKLRQSLPAGRFVALTLVCIEPDRASGEIWIGGTPECLLVSPDGQVIERFVSRQLPLGIIDTDEDLVKTDHFSWNQDCQMVIFSDGLLEAENSANVQFGEEGLLRAIRSTPPHLRHQTTQNALGQHLAGTPAHDDISLLLIDCTATNCPSGNATGDHRRAGE